MVTLPTASHIPQTEATPEGFHLTVSMEQGWLGRPCRQTLYWHHRCTNLCHLWVKPLSQELGFKVYSHKSEREKG